MITTLKIYSPVIVTLGGAAARALLPPSTVTTGVILAVIGVSVLVHIRESRHGIRTLFKRLEERDRDDG